MLNVHSAMSAHNAASRSSVENTRHDNPPMYLPMWIVRLFDAFLSWILVLVFVYTRVSETRYVKFLDQKRTPFMIFDSWHKEAVAKSWIIFVHIE